MGFSEDVYRLASQVSSRKDHCKGNEEATKHSLILPFFQMLGYDIYDPSVLVPEYKAGFASNKEKIDYAIFLKGAPVLFVEAKAIGEQLDNYDAQLAKYFNATPGLKLAVITNGVRYKFFTDLKEPNLLDPDPFFEFELETVRPEDVKTLEDFRAEKFNPAELVTKAENLVYLRALKRKFRSLYREPSDDFVRLMANDIFPRKITASALERLNPLVREAMSAVLLEMVSQGLSQEIAKQDEVAPAPVHQVSAHQPSAHNETTAHAESKNYLVPTEEELTGFQAVYQVIAESCGEDSKVCYKDTTAYFSIQIEKPSRWFVRLHFGVAKKYLVLRAPVAQARAILGEDPRLEEIADSPETCRINISAVQDLKQFSGLICSAYKLLASPVSA